LTNLDKLRKQLEAVKGEIKRLSDFRDTQLRRKFERQLEGEKSVILYRISKITATKEEKEELRSYRWEIANKNRSEKMKRTWRFLKAIEKNYPVKLSLRELRTALRKHRKGLETDVPDVAWRNPSP